MMNWFGLILLYALLMILCDSIDILEDDEEPLDHIQVDIKRVLKGPNVFDHDMLMNTAQHFYRGCSYTISFYVYLHKPRLKERLLTQEIVLFSSREMKPNEHSGIPNQEIGESLLPSMVFNVGSEEHKYKFFFSATKDAKGEDFHGFWAPGSKVEWNKWTHIAWVVSEDSILKGYMNGNLVGSLRMEASKQTFNEGNNVNGVMRCPYNHPTKYNHNKPIPVNDAWNNTILQIMGNAGGGHPSTVGMMQDFIVMRNIALEHSEVRKLVKLRRPKPLPTLDVIRSLYEPLAPSDANGQKETKERKEGVSGQSNARNNIMYRPREERGHLQDQESGDSNKHSSLEKQAIDNFINLATDWLAALNSWSGLNLAIPTDWMSSAEEEKHKSTESGLSSGHHTDKSNHKEVEMWPRKLKEVDDYRDFVRELYNCVMIWQNGQIERHLPAHNDDPRPSADSTLSSHRHYKKSLCSQIDKRLADVYAAHHDKPYLKDIAHLTDLVHAVREDDMLYEDEDDDSERDRMSSRSIVMEKTFSTMAMALWLSVDIDHMAPEVRTPWNFRMAHQISQPLHNLFGYKAAFDNLENVFLPPDLGSYLSINLKQFEANYSLDVNVMNMIKKARGIEDKASDGGKNGKVPPLKDRNDDSFIDDTGCKWNRSERSPLFVPSDRDDLSLLTIAKVVTKESAVTIDRVIGDLSIIPSIDSIDEVDIDDGNFDEETECLVAGSHYFPLTQYIASIFGDTSTGVGAIEDVRLGVTDLGQFQGENTEVYQFNVVEAERGNAQAQLQIARQYFWGQNGLEPNPNIARYWFERAAAQGDPEGLYNMGVLQALGQGGFVANQSAAFHYFFRAAHPEDANQEPFPMAVHAMGNFYLNGVSGKQDLTRARAYFKKAASLGSADGHFSYGTMLHQGQAGYKDVPTAMVHFVKAINMGHIRATNFVAHALYDPESWLYGYGRQESWKEFNMDKEKLQKLKRQEEKKLNQQYENRHRQRNMHKMKKQEKEREERKLRSLANEGKRDKVRSREEAIHAKHRNAIREAVIDANANAKIDSMYDQVDGEFHDQHPNSDMEKTVDLNDAYFAGDYSYHRNDGNREPHMSPFGEYRYNASENLDIMLPMGIVRIPTPLGRGGAATCSAAMHLFRYICSMTYRTNYLMRQALAAYNNGDWLTSLEYYDEAADLGISTAQYNSAVIQERLAKAECEKLQSKDGSGPHSRQWFSVLISGRWFFMAFDWFEWLESYYTSQLWGKRNLHGELLFDTKEQCYDFFNKRIRKRWTQLANNGDPGAKRILAYKLIKSSDYDRTPIINGGEDRNLTEAAFMALYASEQGDAESVMTLGWIFYNDNFISHAKNISNLLFRHTSTFEDAFNSLTFSASTSGAASVVALAYCKVDELFEFVGLKSIKAFTRAYKYLFYAIYRDVYEGFLAFSDTVSKRRGRGYHPSTNVEVPVYSEGEDDSLSAEALQEVLMDEETQAEPTLQIFSVDYSEWMHSEEIGVSDYLLFALITFYILIFVIMFRAYRRAYLEQEQAEEGENNPRERVFEEVDNNDNGDFAFWQ